MRTKDTKPKTKIILDGNFKEEMRIATIDSKNTLVAFEQNSFYNPSLKGYIFTGYIKNIEPAFNAAFIECPDGRNGFLPFKEIDEKYINFQKYSNKEDNNPISRTLRKGTKLVVQVLKDKRENKGFTLTTYIALPGRYCILTTKRKEQVCKYVTDSGEKKRLHTISEKLNKSRNIGIFIKSSAQGKSEKEIAEDFKQLKKLWKKISDDAKICKKSTILYAENSIAKTVIRDIYNDSTKEIIVSGQNTFEEVKEYSNIVLGKTVTNKVIKQYISTESIFNHYDLEKQIHTLYDNIVKLKSGGYIVIDTTEALVAIDVNSGKMRQEFSIEETAFKTNMEATVEIAKQVEIRNLSGLIVIDFIDMTEYNNRKEVEMSIAKAFASYNSTAVIEDRINDFGLMQISKRRNKKSIIELNTKICNTCNGKGRIISPNYVAMKVLRAINGKVINDNYDLLVQASQEIILHLINKHRHSIAALEKDKDIQIQLKINETYPEGGFVIEEIHSDRNIFVYQEEQNNIINTKEIEDTKKEEIKTKKKSESNKKINSKKKVSKTKNVEEKDIQDNKNNNDISIQEEIKTESSIPIESGTKISATKKNTIHNKVAKLVKKIIK